MSKPLVTRLVSNMSCMISCKQGMTQSVTMTGIAYFKKGDRMFKQAIFAVPCLQPRQFVSIQIRFMVLIIAKTQ